MNAIIIRSFGGPEVLELSDVPQPNPSSGEVLIHVRAASVNPIDYKIRSGSHPRKPKLPTILGRDVSGTVEAVGQGVTKFRPGEDVYAFLGSHSGGYAQFVVAKETEIAAKPQSLDFVEAAAVPLAATTAWQALFDHGLLQAGHRVLIHGAAGGVGHFAVQFAKAKGATVFATASAGDFAMLKSLGVDEVIDYEKERFEDRAMNIDLVIDLIDGETQERSWDVLWPGGSLVSTLSQPSEDKARAHDARAVVFVARPRAEQLAEIGNLIDEGKVRVAVTNTYPLNEAQRAHEELENEHSTGKLVLTVP